METIKRNGIKELTDRRRSPCVSVYLPTHVAGAGTQQDPIRLKNLLREAHASLERQGWSADAAEDALRPMRGLIGEYEFWQHRTEGLALFGAPGFFRGYALPFEPPELAVVGLQFHLKPLFPVLDANEPYYLLALHQSGARLFRGDRGGLRPADDIALPASPLAPAADGRGDGRAVQYHPPHGPGRHFPMFRGHNAWDERRKQLLLSYFRSVDENLRNHLEDEAPLVLAGVTYLCALYRHASRISSLAAEEIHGNPDHISGEEMHRRSSQIAASFCRSVREKTADEYYQLWHTARASNDVRDIAAAARDGRVKTLFVAVGVQEWTGAPPPAGPEEAQTGGPAGDRDLLNVAALETFLRGGRVFAVAPDLVPGHGPAAALFRY